MCLRGTGACLAILLVVVNVGCTRTYRATTVLHSDGRVERAIDQPVADDAVIPEEIAKQAGWSAPEVRDSRESGSQTRFAARGTFGSVKDVAEHYRAPDRNADTKDLPGGVLVRRHRAEDLVLVTEHEWVETLADAVTGMDSMRRARDELVDLGISLFSDAFDESLGKDYDASELIGWMRSEGKVWAADLTDSAYVKMLETRRGELAMRGADPEVWLPDVLKDVCARHGLRLDGPVEAGKPDDRIERFFMELAGTKVRRRADRKPIGTEAVKAFVEEAKGADAPPFRFQLAFGRVVATKYDGEKAVGRRAKRLFIQVAGWYLLRTDAFDYTMTVPGDVSRTNGEILGHNRVRWRFKAGAAWPGGYDMAVRSVEPQAETIAALLGERLLSREALAEIASLLRAELHVDSNGVPGRLLTALRNCRSAKSIGPLYHFRDSSYSSKDPFRRDEYERMTRLFELLDLPKDPPVR